MSYDENRKIWKPIYEKGRLVDMVIGTPREVFTPKQLKFHIELQKTIERINNEDRRS